MDIWTILGFSLGGVTVLGLCATCLAFMLKAVINRSLARKNIKLAAKEFSNAAKEELGAISFKQTIQPVCESGLAKVNEKSMEFIKKVVEEQNKKLDQIIRIQEAQAKYFDNSIGVNEEARVELKQAIADAKNTPKIEETQEVEIIIDEKKKDEKIDKKQAKIER